MISPKFWSGLGRGLGGDPPVLLDGPQERLMGLLALVGGDAVAAHSPELLDGADAPEGALARGADRLAGDDYVHRVRVHLREMAQGHPTAPLDLGPEAQVVDL